MREAPHRSCETPAGRIVIGRRNGALVADWEATASADTQARLHHSSQSDTGFKACSDADDPEVAQCAAAVRRYFEGESCALDAIPTGAGTAFQRRVWDACRDIPCGEVRTYGWIASHLGVSRAACRAIGQALRRNPLPIVVPCHRVVGAKGPGGYAGARDGPLLDVKNALLAFEAALISSQQHRLRR